MRHFLTAVLGMSLAATAFAADHPVISTETGTNHLTTSHTMGEANPGKEAMRESSAESFDQRHGRASALAFNRQEVASKASGQSSGSSSGMDPNASGQSEGKSAVRIDDDSGRDRAGAHEFNQLEKALSGQNHAGEHSHYHH